MISGKGPQDLPMWDLIDCAHARGVTTVVGGAGPTLKPSDFVGRADCVVSGGSEPILPALVPVIAKHQRLFDLGYRGTIDLGYDNLIGDIAATQKVLTAMREWNREHRHPLVYRTEATTNLARQPRILDAMRDNEFRYVFIGIESGDEATLDDTKKGQNTARPVEEVVRTASSASTARAIRRPKRCSRW